MCRTCERCHAEEDDFTMLAYRDKALVCQECDAALEREWVAVSPMEQKHYLDTFNPV